MCEFKLLLLAVSSVDAVDAVDSGDGRMEMSRLRDKR